MSKERQEKQEQFSEPEKKGGLGKIIALVAVVAVAAVAGFTLLGPGTTDGFASVKSQGGEVRIDISQVDDGAAHYFNLATDKGEIKFFVVKSIDGMVRAAFDACDVCYKSKKGYRQEGDQMVCNNCNQRFRSDLINEVKGGCNPAPLARRIDKGQLVINERDILAGSWYFGI
jgi:uncharacterized membrane protein